MGLWGALFDIPIPFVSAAPFTFLERVLCILAAKKRQTPREGNRSHSHLDTIAHTYTYTGRKNTRIRV